MKPKQFTAVVFKFKLIMDQAHRRTSSDLLTCMASGRFERGKCVLRRIVDLMKGNTDLK